MIQGVKAACRMGLQAHTQVQSRFCSSSIKSEWKKRRNILFDNEVRRIENAVGRIQKIEVKYQPPAKEADPIVMAMNKDLSTPHECARHLSESTYKTAALALLDDVPWDMHRPIPDSSVLRLLTMEMPKESHVLNPAFWRTCSLIMGAMIESVFKDDIQLYLHSFPRPNLKSGSFVYDAVVDLPDWKPTSAELRALSAEFVKLTNAALPVQRLEVGEELALDMFQDNPYKSKQIPGIAAAHEGLVTLYRIGQHIDISRGPMVGNTELVGRATVAAVHRVPHADSDHLYRFQGVALPRCTRLNHFAYQLLEERARRFNDVTWVPHKLEHEASPELEEQPGTAVASN